MRAEEPFSVEIHSKHQIVPLYHIWYYDTRWFFEAIGKGSVDQSIVRVQYVALVESTSNTICKNLYI